VQFQGDKGRRLRIGNFVSIGPDVKIFVGRQGRHPLDLLSTFPIGMLSPGPFKPARATYSRVFQNSLDVTIGSDVWIGTNAVVLAGIEIGHGAVIGAQSLITKPVPPYSVVGGVPARVIKPRFSQDIVARLLAVRWWDLPLKLLLENLDDLFFEREMHVVADRLEALRALHDANGSGALST
jgi:acetyltransferase-like isoleucine patch superfamily enzyme